MRALPLALLLAAAALPARGGEDPAECPEGEVREATADPLNPFRCAKPAAPGRLSPVAGPKGFPSGPRCPRGTRPASAAPGSLLSRRCVPDEGQPAEPEASPLRDAAAQPAPGAFPARGGASRAPAPPLLYRRYEVPGAVAFEVPKGFRITDGWRDEVPTIHAALDDGRPGRGVSLTLTLYDKRRAAVSDVEAAVAKDKEWQGAKEAGRARAAGRPARLLEVPGESKTAYVDLGESGYLSVAYGSRAGDYAAYLPAFERLLRTLELPPAAAR